MGMFGPFDRLRDRGFYLTLRQAQGPGIFRPGDMVGLFDRLRDRSFFNPSTGSGIGVLLTLRQAQGPGV